MIRNFFNTLRILGMFNLILISGLLLIAIAMYNVNAFSSTVLGIIDASAEHDAYNEIQYDFLDIQQVGRDFLVFEDSAAADEAYQSNQAIIDEQLANLNELDLRVPDGPDQVASMRDNISSDYEQLLSASFSSDNPINPETFALITNQETQINSQMADLVAKAAGEVEDAIRDYQTDRSITIGIGIVLLSAFPLLALWGFTAASGFTAPLIEISNALAAIGGNTFRRGDLDRARRSGAVKALAASMDKMAEAVTERRERLEQEAQSLREQLYTLQESKLETLESSGSREGGKA